MYAYRLIGYGLQLSRYTSLQTPHDAQHFEGQQQKAKTLNETYTRDYGTIACL